ncbi:MAG TPA: ABC transporter permease subunit [Micromonosporaceae bacterium]|nr:ABC transporter permease subunit [Micromonosporaceae bacterium]
MTAVSVATTTDLSRARSRFPQVLRSEWTKVWSVRSTMWTLLSLVVVTMGFSALFAWGQTSNLHRLSAQELATVDPTNTAMAGLAFGQLAIAVLGVMIISSEYSTGGIRTTLTAVPDRLRVLAAKWLVFGILAWVVGTITAFGAFFVAMPFWAHYDRAVSLGDPGVLRAVLGGGLIALASGMLGFALGTLLRHTAGAITAAVALLFVIPPLTNLLPGSWGNAIAIRFTTNASQNISAVVHQPGQLTPWVGYAWMTLEWVVPVLLGAYLMRRRDA